ncbi:MAG: PEP-CTERM sorting domain-containing protein [Planctomycetota bacterium]|nr:MAG: PEP-CTERM sorting domain-containing protein [Planctomycetota bacterium]
MRSFSLLATSLACTAAIATAAQGTIYTDSTFDLFDNGLDNLDISGVDISDDGTNLSIAITTRGFQTWTKYMIFIDSAAGGTTSNAWSRPVNLTSDIDYFVGSWVDASTDNSQFVSWTGSAWNWGSESTLSNSVSANTVTWSFSLASLGLSAGQTFYFDVATSGGGGDPGVDHLSRSDMATSGWGSPSTSGNFLGYTTVPAPGAIALLGLAGLFGRRRR